MSNKPSADCVRMVRGTGCRKLKVSLIGTNSVSVEVLDRVKNKGNKFKHVFSGKILHFSEATSGDIPVSGAKGVKISVPDGSLEIKLAAVIMPMMNLCRNAGS